MTSGLTGRAAFQVLVFPFRQGENGEFEYGLLRRSDARYWQGVAGGGEGDESPVQAAHREAAEEAGVADDAKVVPLESMATLPVVNVTGEFTWGPDVLVIPEHTFGVRCGSPQLQLSDEHTEYAWFAFEEAKEHLRWDSNRNALWELDHRLRHDLADTKGDAHSESSLPTVRG